MKKLFYILILIFTAFVTLCGCGSGKKNKYDSPDDLAKQTFGSLNGTIFADLVKQRYPEAKIKVFESDADAILALETGKIDAFVTEELVYNKVMGSNSKLAVFDNQFYEQQYGFAVAKGSPLKADMDKFIALCKKDGTIDSVIANWLYNNSPQQMPNFDSVPRSGRPIVVATSSVSPPFSYVKDNRNVGIDIEMMERFAAYLGRPIKYNIMSFGAIISAISTHKADIAANCICITDERAKMVDFSMPYYLTNTLIVVKASNMKNTGFKSMKDVEQGIIASVAGSAQYDYLKKTYTQADILIGNSAPDVIMMTKTGKCDVSLIPLVEADIAVKHDPDLAILDDHVLELQMGTGFQKKDVRLKEEYDKMLAELRNSGELEHIIQRWINNDDTVQMPALNFSNAKGELRIGTTLSDPPCTMLKNGGPAGFDMELIYRFAHRIGKKPVIINTDFNGLIANLQSGKVDVIVSGIAITEERSKVVLFSDPYFFAPTAAICLKSKLDNAARFGNSVEELSFWNKIKESFRNNILKEQRYKLILNGLWNTLVISILSIIFGTILGAGICTLRMSRYKILNSTAKAYITLIRNIPVLVLLMIFFYVIFAKSQVNPVSIAILTFAINFSAYVSEMFRTSIQSVDIGQPEAGLAMGFSRFQSFRYVVLPQAIKQVVPVFKGEAISLIKITSVVGYVAVVDLTKASDIIRSNTFDAFFPLIIITIIYFILAWLLDKTLDLLLK